ncbi:MAG: dTMP kinase [Sulfobacillus sp.]
MTGVLIALEGADGAGCTDQARRLGDWLVAAGHQVVPCRIKGSELMRRPLQTLQRRADLSDRALFLLYAADLADLYRHQIAPALDLGQVVLCDRYLLTPLVRAELRGIDHAWAQAALSFLPAPTLTVLLCAPASHRLTRLLNHRRFLQPRETGWPMRPGSPLLAQALRYQRHLARQYALRTDPEQVPRINTGQHPDRAQGALQRLVSAVLPAPSATAESAL